MKAEISVLKSAKNQFYLEDNKIYWRNGITLISAEILLKRTTDRKLLRLLKLCRFIVDDFSNIATLIHRLDLIRELSLSNNRIKNLWFYYAQVDINMFFIEIRSIMDYVAEIVSLMSINPNQVPSNSFEKLKNWINKEINRKKIDADFIEIIREANWFNDIREVRNNLIHFGYNTFIFGYPKDGVLFKISEGSKNSIKIKDFLVYNENNIVYFDRYVALYLSYLLRFFRGSVKSNFSKIKHQA